MSRAILIIAPLLLVTSFRAGAVTGEAAKTASAMALLRANCLSCHNSEKTKGDLNLTTRELALKGGENGPALVPGQAEESRILKVVKKDGDPHMPPKKQLSDGQIKTLRDWLHNGGDWDAKILLAPVDDNKLVTLVALPAAYQPALALTLSPDEKKLAVGRGNRIQIHDLTTTNRTVIATLETAGDVVQSLAWSADGKRLAAGGFRQITVWDAASLKPALSLTNALIGRITALEFSPDSKTLYSADGATARSGVVHVWNTETGAHQSSWEAHKDTIFGMKISRDGKFLATGSADKLAKLWDVASRKETARFEGHTSHVIGVAFNADTTQLVTGAADKEIKVWDIRTREQVTLLGNRESVVTGLSWSPDGKAIVAIFENGASRIFTDLKTHTGEERPMTAKERRLTSQDEMLYCVTSTTDAKTIYAGSHSGTIYIWGDDGKAKGKIEAPKPAIAAANAPADTKTPAPKPGS
ncbi:MAG TPA: c-type cytochrome domain-containing protein [Roseimicrobium sp.]|nr:c-type cytochrome domain-containing protein [Roseimicrobium sp.]